MHVPRSGPSRWHPATCPGTFIDAMKYDTARAIGPEAARAAAERAATSPREDSRRSTDGRPARAAAERATANHGADSRRSISGRPARAAAERATASFRDVSRLSYAGRPARAAAERATASFRDVSRRSIGGSPYASGESLDSGSSPWAKTTQQKGCAKCGLPISGTQETSWARHGPRVGLRYHRLCRNLPWPDPAQVALYTGIPECSPIRRQVTARVSKCNVCGQGKQQTAVSCC